VDYEITVRHIPQQAAMTIRTTVGTDQIGAALADILPTVLAYLQQKGVAPTGPPFARYGLRAADAIDVEGGLPVAESLAGEGRITSTELPGGEAAATWHVGPYDTLPNAHSAIERWLLEHNRGPSGRPWEVYWTDPGEVPDPAEWKTEIIYPLA
jgi:AraC family transcriptional regulator